MSPNPDTPSPAPRRSGGLRAGLVLAAVLVAVPLAAKLAQRAGWPVPADVPERSLMATLAAYIVWTGNSIPKRIVRATCANAPAESVRGFLRLAGWTWVLAGLAWGTACVMLPARTAALATFTLLPGAIAIVALAWLRLRGAGRRTA